MQEQRISTRHVCTSCNRTFRCKSGLISHSLVHKDAQFSCLKCNKWFKTNYGSQRHELDCVLRCKYCGFKLNSKEMCNLHENRCNSANDVKNKNMDIAAEKTTNISNIRSVDMSIAKVNGVSKSVSTDEDEEGEECPSNQGVLSKSPSSVLKGATLDSLEINHLQNNIEQTIGSDCTNLCYSTYPQHIESHSFQRNETAELMSVLNRQSTLWDYFDDTENQLGNIPTACGNKKNALQNTTDFKPCKPALDQKESFDIATDSVSTGTNGSLLDTHKTSSSCSSDCSVKNKEYSSQVSMDYNVQQMINVKNDPDCNTCVACLSEKNLQENAPDVKLCITSKENLSSNVTRDSMLSQNIKHEENIRENDVPHNIQNSSTSIADTNQDVSSLLISSTSSADKASSISSSDTPVKVKESSPQSYPEYNMHEMVDIKSGPDHDRLSDISTPCFVQKNGPKCATDIKPCTLIQALNRKETGNTSRAIHSLSTCPNGLLQDADETSSSSSSDISTDCSVQKNVLENAVDINSCVTTAGNLSYNTTGASVITQNLHLEVKTPNNDTSQSTQSSSSCLVHEMQDYSCLLISSTLSVENDERTQPNDISPSFEQSSEIAVSDFTNSSHALDQNKVPNKATDSLSTDPNSMYLPLDTDKTSLSSSSDSSVMNKKNSLKRSTKYYMDRMVDIDKLVSLSCNEAPVVLEYGDEGLDVFQEKTKNDIISSQVDSMDLQSASLAHQVVYISDDIDDEYIIIHGLDMNFCVRGSLTVPLHDCMKQNAIHQETTARDGCKEADRSDETEAHTLHTGEVYAIVTQYQNESNETENYVLQSNDRDEGNNLDNGESSEGHKEKNDTQRKLECDKNKTTDTLINLGRNEFGYSEFCTTTQGQQHNDDSPVKTNKVEKASTMITREICQGKTDKSKGQTNVNDDVDDILFGSKEAPMLSNYEELVIDNFDGVLSSDESDWGPSGAENEEGSSDDDYDVVPSSEEDDWTPSEDEVSSDDDFIPVENQNGEKSYLCKICNKTFKNSSSLRKHRFVHAKASFPCSKCKKMFKRKDIARVHECRCVLKCKYCGLNLASKELCKVHEKEKQCKSAAVLSYNSRDARMNNVNDDDGNITNTSEADSGKVMENIVSKSAWYDENDDLEIQNDTTYVCQICNETLTNSSNLIRHLSVHIEARQHLSCSKCNKVLERDNVHWHEWSCVRKCKHCRIKFGSEEQCNLHENENRCKNINYEKTTNISEMKSADNSDERVNSVSKTAWHGETGEDVGSKENLNLSLKSAWYDEDEISSSREDVREKGICNRDQFHIISMHLPPLPISCKICHKECRNPKTYKYHMQTKHTTPKFLCSYCGKGYSEKSHLRNHESTHTDIGTDEKFPCTKCGQMFRRHQYLQKHISRVHSEVRKYLCHHCGKAFKTKEHLKAHELTHGDRIFKCDLCEKGFKTPKALKNHKLGHIGVEFKCSSCDASFTCKRNLTTHKLIHKGVKPHVCEYCGKRFTLKHHLGQHVKTHTNERPYKCKKCGHAFKIGHHLTQHMATHEDKPWKKRKK